MNVSHGRVRRIAVLAALLTGTVTVAAGCGSSDEPAGKGVAAIGSAAPSAQSAGNDGERPSDQQIYDTLLKYAKCMRQHGVSNFPDPVLGKGLEVNGNEVDNNPNHAAAEAACKSLIPPAPAGERDPAGDRAKALAYSKCMRENGVTKFPDPAGDGSLGFDGDKLGMDPGDPTFKNAEKACQSLMGEVNTNAK